MQKNHPSHGWREPFLVTPWRLGAEVLPREGDTPRIQRLRADGGTLLAKAVLKLNVSAALGVTAELASDSSPTSTMFAGLGCLAFATVGVWQYVGAWGLLNRAHTDENARSCEMVLGRAAVPGDELV